MQKYSVESVRRMVEDIPTEKLLQDIESRERKSPSDRFSIVFSSMKLGAIGILVATLPLAVYANHVSSIPKKTEGSQDGKTCLYSAEDYPPRMQVIDISTLQDGVSALGFIIDPPSAEIASPLEKPAMFSENRHAHSGRNL